MPGEAFLRRMAGLDDALADPGAGLRGNGVGGQQRGDRRHRDLDVDAVEDWAGESGEIPHPIPFPACAPLSGAVVEPARAGVGRHDELEVGRVIRGAARTGEHHMPGFQRLAQGLQCAGGELRCLVHEQDAAVGAGDRPRLGQSAATADQRGTGGRMMRRLERRDVRDAVVLQRAAQGADRGHLQLLAFVQRAHDAGQT